MEYTQREIIYERWARGKLDYKFHEGQRKLVQRFKDCPHQLFVSECARQFGKSFTWVAVALAYARAHPGSKIKYGTAFHTDLMEFIMPAFETVMKDCPKKFRAVFRVAGSKFIDPNGAEIKLVGLDKNPNGLRGNAIDLIILDEAGFITNLDYLYKSVIIPATTHRPHCKIVMSSTPPSTPAHPFLDYVQKAELEGSYVKMTIYDNPMVDDKTVRRLMSETGCKQLSDGTWKLSTTWRREYLCEHVTDEDLAIVKEWKDEYIQEVPRDAFYPFYHKYVGMDLGVRDNTACLFGYYDFKKASLLIEDEFVMNGPDLTTLELQRTICGHEFQLWGEQKPYLRISDNNNPLLLQDLSILHGLNFMATDKAALEEMVNAVKLMMDRGQILVHPRCKQLIGCLKYGVWEKNRTKFAHSKVFGHFDALAALIYLVRNLNRHSNPIPLTFQVDMSEQLLLRKTRDSDASAVLRRAFNLRG